MSQHGKRQRVPVNLEPLVYADLKTEAETRGVALATVAGERIARCPYKAIILEQGEGKT